MCRGIAEKEYKQGKATVAHYERLLKEARYDLAAFGRAADDVTVPMTPEQEAVALTEARNSWQRAQGAVEFARAGDEKVLDVLRDLVEAVAGLLDDRP